jgi:hypothetical protein
MEEDALIPVNLWLAGRSYRILVKSAEEEQVRKMVKIADDKIAELKQHYAGKDDQDFVAMCLLMYAAENKGEHASQLEDALEAIVAKIDNVLGDE